MSTTQLETVAWDLEDLVGGEGPEGSDRLLDEATKRAGTFREQLRREGRRARRRGPGPGDGGARRALVDLVGRAGNYAALRFSTDTASPENGALMARVQERSTQIETTLLFFELEWAALDDERADALLAGPDLDQVRHHLTSVRRYRPHLLSEPEERIMAEKDQSGSEAWTRLFSELTSAVEVELPDGRVALDVALSRLASPDREVRRTTQEAVTEALRPGPAHPGLHPQHAPARQGDRRPPAQLPDLAVVAQPLQRGLGRVGPGARGGGEGQLRPAAPLVRAEGQLLGLPRLADYDRMAAVADEDEDVAWDDARDMVLASFHDFSPVLGRHRRALLRRALDRRARAAGQARRRVLRLHRPERPPVRAPELHVQAPRRAHARPRARPRAPRALAQPRGVFEQHTPLTLAETASVFGETLVFRRLLDAADTPASRLSLLAENIEGSIATVFRQTAMNQFEERAHTARRTEGELSVDRIGELWAASQSELLGDAVEVTDNYKLWWSYVPHFIGTPGYVYAYAYGQLLALSVYGQYLARGEDFVPPTSSCSARAAPSRPRSSRRSRARPGRPGFWASGIELVRGQLEAPRPPRRRSWRTAPSRVATLEAWSPSQRPTLPPGGCRPRQWASRRSPREAPPSPPEPVRPSGSQPPRGCGACSARCSSRAPSR
jgi:oligoendopeptidase F